MFYNFQVEETIRKLQQREFEKRKTLNKMVEIFQEIPDFIKELIWVNHFPTTTVHVVVIKIKSDIEKYG